MNRMHNFSQVKSISISYGVFGAIFMITCNLILGMDKYGPFEVNGKVIGGIILRNQYPLAFIIPEILFGLTALIFFVVALYYQFFSDRTK